MLMFFVDAIPDLLQAFRITGDGGDIVRPVFILSTPFALEGKETGPLFFRDRGEQLAAALRTDIPAIGMFMDGRPFGKSGQRVCIFKDQVLGQGEYFFVSVRKTQFQIICDAGHLTNAIQQSGSTAETSGGCGYS